MLLIWLAGSAWKNPKPYHIQIRVNIKDKPGYSMKSVLYMDEPRFGTCSQILPFASHIQIDMFDFYFRFMVMDPGTLAKV